MKTTIILIASVLAIQISVFAQKNIQTVLSSIETNNTTLKSSRENAEARKLNNKSMIALPAPEIGFGYLWGSPAETGNRIDFSVTQSFDIPTLIGTKNKLAKQQNQLVDLQYQIARMNILLEAKQLCVDLIYYNILQKELNTRLQHAQIIAQAYEKKLQQGDSNILEYNKAKLNFTNVQGELSRVEMERKALLTQLKGLNGGQEIMLDEYQYSEKPLPLSFDEWYAQAVQKNPFLEYASRQVEVNQREVTASKTAALPTFTVGYMSEKVVGQKYQGITTGISIPLWENKNRIKQAKAQLKAAESEQADIHQKHYTQWQLLYNRAAGLQQSAKQYKAALETASNNALLKKALDVGEISILEYILEMSFYYDSITQALQAERDYQQAVTELLMME